MKALNQCIYMHFQLFNLSINCIRNSGWGIGAYYCAFRAETCLRPRHHHVSRHSTQSLLCILCILCATTIIEISGMHLIALNASIHMPFQFFESMANCMRNGNWGLSTKSRGKSQPLHLLYAGIPTPSITTKNQ